MDIPSFNKLCKLTLRGSETILGYMDFGDQDIPVWFNIDSEELVGADVSSWEYVCRDCEGSGLFYQIEDCKCHCQEDL